MKKILITAIAILMTLITSVNAQDMMVQDELIIEPEASEAPIIGAVTNTFLRRGLVSFEYNMSFPVGDLKDFISSMGFRGFHFEYKAVLDDNWTIGGSIGWYGWYEKLDRATYDFEGGALTTTIFRYFYTLPLKVVSQYYFLPDAFIQPFVGLSAGVSYCEIRQEIGFLVITDKPWNFTVTPEVGVLIPFGSTSSWGAVIKGRYNFMVYNKNNFNSVQYIDATFGLVYSY